MSPPRTGRVIEFDEHVGLGVVADGADETFPFHCTQIVDGSRTIDVGTSVVFVVVENRPKGPEAYEISKI